MVVADGWTGIQAALAHAPWLMIQRFAFDLVAIVLLTGGIYYRHHRRTDLFLTIVSGNLTVFVITLLLSQSEMSIGAAFGLFAVFSMLRFRTESLSAREMSYLFLSIALGLAMAIAPLGISDWLNNNVMTKTVTLPETIVRKRSVRRWCR